MKEIYNNNKFMKHLRIFPHRTNATPVDDCVIINRPPTLFDFADKISISVAFTYDIPVAEKLYNSWKYVAPCEIGGPAYNVPSGAFLPGLFLKQGYVITSRGCNNNCWFCSVPGREGALRLLDVTIGNNVLDDNFLQCPISHRTLVYDMLAVQSERVSFTGGLESKMLTKWDSDRLFALKCKSIYFAYDPGDALDDLRYAMSLLLASGFKISHHILKCYVLIGFEGDSKSRALRRLKDVFDIGFVPMSMLYRNYYGIVDSNWVSFNTIYANPFSVIPALKAINHE